MLSCTALVTDTVPSSVSPADPGLSLFLRHILGTLPSSLVGLLSAEAASDRAEGRCVNGLTLTYIPFECCTYSRASKTRETGSERVPTIK